MPEYVLCLTMNFDKTINVVLTLGDRRNGTKWTTEYRNFVLKPSIPEIVVTPNRYTKHFWMGKSTKKRCYPRSRRTNHFYKIFLCFQGHDQCVSIDKSICRTNRQGTQGPSFIIRFTLFLQITEYNKSTGW